jgi:signal transduction histidine kinase
VQFRLGEVARHWDRVRLSAEERAKEEMNADLGELVDRADTALAGTARAVAGASAAGPGVFEEMFRLRRETGVSALAVYEADGSPLAWSGEHRGTVPDSVRQGTQPYSFSAGPLFGYVYFTQRLPGGRTAMAATLLESHVAVSGVRPLAERFGDRHGITPHFTEPDLAQGEAVFDWKVTEDQPILSVVFSTLTQDFWREREAERGRWAVGTAWLCGMLLLSVAWFAGRAGPAGVPVAVATASLLVLPWGKMAGTEGIFSPLGFVLPLPGDVNLGQFLIVLGGVAVWLLSRARPGGQVRRLPLAVRAVLAGGALAGALALVRASVAEPVLAGQPAGGMALAAALALAAAIPLFVLLGHDPDAPAESRRTGGAAWAAPLLLSALLALGLVLWWEPGREPPVWSAALWAVPFALLAALLPRSRPRWGALLPWIAAGWIAGTMALPHLWIMHLDARLAKAERDLSHLGTGADPFLDFLLRQFAEKVLRSAAEGREGVSLLYQAWVEGKLAREGYEARVTLWDGPVPAAELRLSDRQVPPDMVPRILEQARAAEEPILERFSDREDVHYLLAVPLPGGRTVTVGVPPRRHLGRSTALARFLDPVGNEESPAEGTDLSLVPAASHPAVAPAAEMRWLRTDEGWRSETVVRFPEGDEHAHLLVRTPATPMLVVRGVLALVALMGGLAALWSLARTLCGEPLGIASGELGWAWTFRGRLTLALFAFFLVPMAAFGATAYQALSREVVRTAEALAHRALAQAETEVQAATLGELSQHVGADLLLYHDGVLVEGGSPEVIELGLYPTWLPVEVYLNFRTGEGTEAQQRERRIAGQQFLVAYRRMAGGDVLAAPTPLAAGEIALRQREMAAVGLLAGLVGAALSVVLALLVGRALSRPIEGLTRAAAAVGSGDLSVRLPRGRRDEFGGLYRSFNRMVRGLRQARTALVRETRRTEAIVAEAGTGVVALDTAGRVALINRRACEILGAEVEAGVYLPRDRALPREVARVVERFLAGSAREGTEEREVEGRVVRLRLRRLPSQKGTAGAVLVLEDVTAEIRSARVLAWGEMARQVAHEIKNPLTPIKLAVQHIRRAHGDGRADFGVILNRNVEAVLREIDRLGEIARAFARFGTPADAAEPPEPVDAVRVVEETLGLYRGGQDGIAYRVEAEPEAPRAFARVGELKEVLVNLLENARAALHEEGGEVRIGVAAAGGGAWVHVDVADSGEGIPPELLSRVFDPHFSTKSSGTGLGLAIVRRLVESWGGEVTVDSEPGVGTTVHLRLRAEEAGVPSAVVPVAVQD